MTDALLVAILGQYGPLALGWVGFFVMLLRDARMRERLIDVVEANTESHAALLAKVDALLLRGGER